MGGFLRAGLALRHGALQGTRQGLGRDGIAKARQIAGQSTQSAGPADHPMGKHVAGSSDPFSSMRIDSPVQVHPKQA
jgi:hypothetical protein